MNILKNQNKGKQIVVFYCTKQMHFENILTLINGMQDVSMCYTVLVFKKGKFEASKVSYQKMPETDRLWDTVSNAIVITPATGINANISKKNTLVHIMHSLVDIEGVYKVGAFDSFHYVACATSYQVRHLQLISASRKTNLRYLIPSGYPKLDRGIEQARLNKGSIVKNRVIYAPTLVNDQNREYSSLLKCGYDIVALLIDMKYNVVFRPHPLSCYKEEKEIIDKIVGDFSGEEKFTYDVSQNYMPIFETSRLLITDVSGTAFTYSFIYEKPSVFYHVPSKSMTLSKGFLSEGREKIGSVVSSLSELSSVVNKYLKNESLCNQKSNEMVRYRNEVVCKIGISDDSILESIVDISNNKIGSDWVQL